MFGRSLLRAKRLLIGRPLATEEEIGERLSKKKALAIFSSDAISSSAYATEEILKRPRRGRRGGAVREHVGSRSPSSSCSRSSRPATARSASIPAGGGAYAVAKDNLARCRRSSPPAALLVDYILTVAVSISSA